MAIDLKTHEAKLLAAWRDVTEDKSSTDWALFGYDGHTNTLKVVSTGDGGLTEMSEDLNSNKIMYAFCRLLDPKTGLPKYVLINWQGEGAPMGRKGSCTNHMRDVASLLHGHHVTVHARDEDEVDEEAILEKLSRAGSSVYNFRQRSTETSPQNKPVGTNYHRIVPTAEIDLTERDRFWERQEQEERQRQQEEMRRAGDEKARLETERNRREMEEAKTRRQHELERSRNISEVRQAERNAERVVVSHGATAEASLHDKPVGTNYHRIVPTAEINLTERDRFWERQEQEERQRQQEEMRRAGDEKARLETERNRRELEEAKTRAHHELERSRNINEARQAERKAERVLSQDDQQAARWQQSLQQDQREEEERKHRADRLRAERKQEAQELIGHRTGAARAVFESHSAAGQLSGAPTSPLGRAGVSRRWPPAATAHSTDHQEASGGRPPARHNGSAASAGAVSNGHQPSEPPSLSPAPAEPARTAPAPASAEPPRAQYTAHPADSHRQPEPAPAPVRQPEPAPAPVRQSEPDPVTAKPSEPAPAPAYKQPEPTPAPAYKQPEPTPAPAYKHPEPEATPVPAYKQPEPAPAYKQPEPAPTYKQPEPEPAYRQPEPAPVYKQPEPEPAYRQPEPAPTYKQPEPEPAYRQPEPAPAYTQPEPAPAYKHSEPAPAYKQPEPAPAYTQPEPAPAYKHSEPAPAYKQPEPAPVYKQPEPAPVYKQPEPAPAYKQPEPAPAYKQPEPAPAYKQPEPEPEPVPTPAYTQLAEPAAAPERGQPDGGGGGGQSLLTGDVQITTVTGELASVSIAPEHGLCAQALYDYQAVDETEITFDPGDIITNIEQIDEGWWQGVSPAGQFGLFPANYVQLINA